MLNGLFPGFNQFKFDPETELIGKACMINVVNETSSKGRKFAKITAVTPIPKGMDCPDQINQDTYFFMGYNEAGPQDFDDAVFARLPKFIQEKIMLSPEYQKLAPLSVKNPNATEEEKEKSEKKS